MKVFLKKRKNLIVSILVLPIFLFTFISCNKNEVKNEVPNDIRTEIRTEKGKKKRKNHIKNQLITKFRITLPPPDAKIEYEDLDNDGDPDVLRSLANDGTPIQWIDDDDDMKEGDLEGDMDSDCLMIDRNRDGHYGSEKDLIIDWNDEDGDNQPDMQMVADNGAFDDINRFRGHYMWMIDTDNDNIFNFIDWNKYTLEAWDHEGRCNFFKDYNGNTIFLKEHTSPFHIKDLRYNWENPFLFYDVDDDGVTEMTVRLAAEVHVDWHAPEIENIDDINDEHRFAQCSNFITNAMFSFDMDNDSRSSNELDFDMSLRFKGLGFNYSDQVHKFKSMKGLPGSEKFFADARWRQMDELIYADHETAMDLTLNRGKWNLCWFVFDEDDDCHRWERVEFYSPSDPFKVGSRNKGVDDNPQADVMGDRGEWDEDFSGKGKLYLGCFDGRIHLYGAEWGCWRIDQFTFFYQGWQGWRGPNLQPENLIDIEPDIFPTIIYKDTDNNGFLDKFEYDLDGDTKIEETISLKELGISDTAALIDITDMKYEDYHKLYIEMAQSIWDNSMEVKALAEEIGLNTVWYANLLSPKSIRQKYHYGYWLTFYLYQDMKYWGNRKKDNKFLKELKKAYYSGNWEGMSSLL